MTPEDIKQIVTTPKVVVGMNKVITYWTSGYQLHPDPRRRIKHWYSAPA